MSTVRTSSRKRSSALLLRHRIDGDALYDAVVLTGREGVVGCLAVFQGGEQRQILRENQIRQSDQGVVQTVEPRQHYGGPVRLGDRLGADHRDGVLAQLRADFGD